MALDRTSRILLSALVVVLLGVAAAYLLMPQSEPEHGAMTVVSIGPVEGALGLQKNDVRENAPTPWKAIQQAQAEGVGTVDASRQDDVAAFLEDHAGGGQWWFIQVGQQYYAVRVTTF